MAYFSPSPNKPIQTPVEHSGVQKSNPIEHSSLTCDTHHYDGALRNNIDNALLLELEVIKSIKVEEKKTYCCDFVVDFGINILNEQLDSVKYLQIIINDWGNSSNFDPTNNISAEDLLYICAVEWNNLKLTHLELCTDFIEELCIQCSDMQTGFCPQGRVARLWQIASAYFTFFETQNR